MLVELFKRKNPDGIQYATVESVSYATQRISVKLQNRIIKPATYIGDINDISVGDTVLASTITGGSALVINRVIKGLTTIQNLTVI